MNPKKLNTLLGLVVVVLLIVIGYFVWGNQFSNQTSSGLSSEEMRQELPAFNMTLPEGLVSMSQNLDSNLSTAIAVPINKFDELQASKSFPGNPLLAAIETGVPYLSVNKSTAKVENLKDFLPTSVDNPKGGSFDVAMKEYTLRYTDNDLKIDQYEYVYQIKSNPPVDRHGFIWQGNNGNIYQIEINDKENDKTFGVTDTLLEDMAIRLLFTYTE